VLLYFVFDGRERTFQQIGAPLGALGLGALTLRRRTA
jgi:MYXO-CTERM domain-containing protein